MDAIKLTLAAALGLFMGIILPPTFIFVLFAATTSLGGVAGHNTIYAEQIYCQKGDVFYKNKRIRCVG